MTGRRIGWMVALGTLAAGVAGAAYWYTHREAATGAAEAEAAPIASVQGVPLTTGTVQVTVTAFGTVEAAPGETETFSVPFESRVARVLVVDGQEVDTNDILVEVRASPDARLQLDQARQEREAAQAQRNMAQSRYEMKLATRQERLQAETALSAAALRLRSLENRGLTGTNLVRASRPAIVSHVDVQQGQIVPAGGPLVETVGRDRIVVRLQVEPEDARPLRVGQDIHFEPVNGPAGMLAGRIMRISHEVNPQTRLLSVFAMPADGTRLLLNEYVRGRIAVASVSGLTVPPEAVLSKDGAYVLFTIEKGHAVKHAVTPGAESDGRMLVIGDGLQGGQMVVTVGASQVEDGMAVRVEGTP